MNRAFPPLIYSTLCFIILIMFSCSHPPFYVPETSTLYLPTRGYFSWIGTTTPHGKITPATAGYTQQLVGAVDSYSNRASDVNYIAFYKNDSLQKRYNETYTQQYALDFRNYTITIQYDSVGYLKWHIGASLDTLQLGHFLNPYNAQADTVISTYVRDRTLNGALKLPIR